MSDAPNTRSYYPYVIPAALDRAGDRYYEENIPAGTAFSVRQSYVVPSGEVWLLRSVVLRVPRTGTAMNVIMDAALDRTTSQMVVLLGAVSETTGAVNSWRYVNAVFSLLLPAGSTVYCRAGNTGSGSFLIGYSLLLDVLNA